jgi:peptidoglycan/LPS O-acetylase OafA/YrhL
MLAAGVATYGVLTLVKREWLAPMHELTLRDLLGSGATTLQYTLFFIAGVVLAARLTVLHAALSDLPKVVRRLLWLAAALLLSIPDYDNSFTLFFFSSLLGAALLLLLCLDSPAAQRVLTLKPLHWLGRVSYSLYLVHLVVIVALVRALHLQVAAPLLLLAAVPLSLLVAEVFYQLVERPSQSLGRRLAARVERSMDGFGGRGGRSLRTG